MSTIVLVALLASPPCQRRQPADRPPNGHAQPDSGNEQPRYGRIEQVPAEFLGSWILARQVCEPDSGEAPRAHLPNAMITFMPDHAYDMGVEGFPSIGTFTVESLMDGNRLVLDGTLLHFRSVNGTLENWGEGDAPYLCGNVFIRNR